jgi:uroporphyrinogen-III decarboxylase
MPLTSRDRLLRVLRHEPTDRLPIAPMGMHPWHWSARYPDYQPIIEAAKRHCDFFVSMGLDTGLLYGDPSECEQTNERKELPDGSVEVTTTYLTPKGPVTSIRRRLPDSGDWRVKALIESEEDLERVLSIPYKPHRPDLSDFLAGREKIGDLGVAYLNGLHSPACLLGGAMSEEFRAIYFFTQPKRLHEILEQMAERVHAMVDYVLAAGVGPAFRWYAMESFTEPLMPPSFTDEFIVPYDVDLIRKIHAAGGYVAQHCHGRLGAMIEKMVRVGYDGVDCTESPPQNDVTLAEMLDRAKAAAGHDRALFFWGYVQMDDLEHKSGDEIEQEVREAIRMGGTDGRYVLSQAASPYMAHVPPRMQANWIRMLETGARCGGHAG